jgi:hypothetical protein
MKAQTIAKAGADAIAGARHRSYGDPAAGLQRIAAVWNGILSAAGIPTTGRPLDAHDVANLMEGLKIARRYTGPYRSDNYIDGAGWAAVAGEVGAKVER